MMKRNIEKDWYIFPDQIKISLLIMHGAEDPRIDVSQEKKLADKLEDLDAEFKLEIFEGGDHSLRTHPRRKNSMIQSWLDRHLGN